MTAATTAAHRPEPLCRIAAPDPVSVGREPARIGGGAMPCTIGDAAAYDSAMSVPAPDRIRYVVTSKLGVAEAQARLEQAIQQRKFSILHVYDLTKTLHEKGFELPAEVRVLELCNAGQAFRVMQHEIGMNMALPCRISIWQVDGQTHVGMLRPKVLLHMLSSNPALAAIADEVEQQMIAMVDAAR